MKQDFALPPGPNSPRFLQLAEAILYPLRSLESHAHRYGDRYTSRLFSTPTLILSHPTDLQVLFEADSDCFEVGSTNRLLEPLVGCSSLFLLDGAEHRRQRKLLTPPFHGERLKSYSHSIIEITESTIHEETEFGKPFSIRRLAQTISLRVILRTVFGVEQGDRCDQLQFHLCKMLDLLDSPASASFFFVPALQLDLGLRSPWGAFLMHREVVDRLIFDEIAERKQDPDPERSDILALLMKSVDEAGSALTAPELRDELLTLLLAGHETTAAAITWALYWLHSQPELLQTLLDGLPAPDPSSPESILKHPFLDAVCKETLRIYPVAIFASTRILRRSFDLNGLKLPPGVQLSACIYLLHQNPGLYPDPRTFNPNRFLETTFKPYEYLPFGGGNRRCIGAAFAQFELKWVLATLLTQHRFELMPTKQIVQPRRRGVTFAPNQDLQLKRTDNRH